MSDECPTSEGEVIPPTTLELPRAHALAALLGRGTVPFVRLIECRRHARLSDNAATESVVFEVDVERPQAPVHDIRRRERIAAIFTAADSRPPETLALRPDFPRVPHLNQTGREFPRSLCLYDRPWPEVAIRWTPATYIERIREWLRLTATGTLHQEDQPLEPLLFGDGLRIFLPADLLKDLEADQPDRLDIGPLGDQRQLRNLYAAKPTEGKPGQRSLRFVATTFRAQPQTHGIIRSTPRDLLQLHDFLTDGGIDLVGELRRRFKDWDSTQVRTAQLVLLVAFPLKRSAAGSPEKWELWVFMTTQTVREIGVAIGIWTDAGEHVGVLLRPDDVMRGADVPISVVSPYLEFSRETAAAAGGVIPDSRKTVVVGAGALGSQVIALLAKSGFGAWTVVDEDDLLPHNLARHALIGDCLGMPKAQGVSDLINSLYKGPSPAQPIVADVLSPGNEKDSLTHNYAAADLILDAAASVPVARHLALDVQSEARRVSVFLNPTGTDLIMLVEDRDRTLPLDVLEAQYYRAAATDPELAAHLAAAPGRLRYGRTCRDLTSTIPTHLVSMHAAIASQAIRRALESHDAAARVWRCDTTTMAVTPVEVRPAPTVRERLGDWTLVIDSYLRTKLASLRSSKLPNETGGVLIGMYDLIRRTLYVVDTVPSPPDSVEWPTLYVRGSERLLERVREFGDRSGGQLEYVGEWHSHPRGCPPHPSSDDFTVFSWLTDHMADAGLPALMAIIGDGDASNWFLGQVHPDTTWSFT